MSDLREQVSIGTDQNVIQFSALLALKRSAEDWLKMPGFKRSNPHLTEQLEMALYLIEKSEAERHARAKVVGDRLAAEFMQKTAIEAEKRLNAPRRKFNATDDH